MIVGKGNRRVFRSLVEIDSGIISCRMKTRITSWILLGLMGIIVLGLGFYTRKVSSEARVVIEWSTASELHTVGYNLYRSENSTDPGELVNIELIPVSEDAQTGGDYRYIDMNVVPGRVYCYYLEDVNADGTTNRHGPVEVKAQASGKIELFVTIALSAVTLFGFASLIWPRSKTG